MPGLHNTFGIAVRNFTAYPEMPDARALVEYGVKMEQMGFDSLWVWDHILLGVEPSFPIVDSLTLLTAIAARTSKIKLATGILVLPLRNPVVLAKQLASMDQLSDGRLLLAMASGWYRREFDAVGVPFEQVQDNTGFRLERGSPETAERPSARELEFLRRLDPDRLYTA